MATTDPTTQSRTQAKTQAKTGSSQGRSERRFDQLEHEVAQLRAVMEQQRRDAEEARIERQRLVDELAELRGPAAGAGPAARRRSAHRHPAGRDRGTARRALLKWAGAAAAAAAVTAVATEQTAHAADGNNLVIGQTNTGSHKTILQPVSASNPDYLFEADNSTSVSNPAIGLFPSGVHGRGAPSGAGVVGFAANSDGNGVVGLTDAGWGAAGFTLTGIDLAALGTGRLFQEVQVASGAPTIGSFLKGEQLRDGNGDLFLCVADGTPGTWKRVPAIPAGKLGGAIVFLPKPFRIFDTRPGVAGVPIDPGTPMIPTQISTLQVTGTASTTDSTLVVPTGATGIVGDLLCINTIGNGVTVLGSGFLTLQPHNPTPTGNSYLHYNPGPSGSGQVFHNSFVIGVDSTGKLDVGNFNSTTNVGIDIMGYII